MVSVRTSAETGACTYTLCSGRKALTKGGHNTSMKQGRKSLPTALTTMQRIKSEETDEREIVSLTRTTPTFDYARRVV